MSTRTFLMATGAAALILTGASGAEAGWRQNGKDFGARAVPAQPQSVANVARTSQSGNRNAAAIRQNGTGNVARTIQRGDDNQAEIGQTGDSNRGRIIQVGDGHHAVLHQDGGQRSNIIQVNKGNASVDIQTGQGRPKHSMSGAAAQRGAGRLRKPG